MMCVVFEKKNGKMINNLFREKYNKESIFDFKISASDMMWQDFENGTKGIKLCLVRILELKKWIDLGNFYGPFACK